MTRLNNIDHNSSTTSTRRSSLVNKLSLSLSLLSKRQLSKSASKTLDTTLNKQLKHERVESSSTLNFDWIHESLVPISKPSRPSSNPSSTPSATTTVDNGEIFGSSFDKNTFRWGVTNESSQQMKSSKAHPPSYLRCDRRYVGGGAVVDAYNAMKETELSGISMHDCCITLIEDVQVPVCYSEADVLKAIEENLRSKNLL